MFQKQTFTANRRRLSLSLIFKLFCTVILVAAATNALGQISPSKESLSDLYPGKAYSPYADSNFPERVFWGVSHLHTGLSVDGGLFGARLGLVAG